MPSQQPRPEGKGFFWHASVFKKALGWNTNQCFAHSRHSRSDDEIEPKLVKDVLLRGWRCALRIKYWRQIIARVFKAANYATLSHLVTPVLFLKLKSK